MKKIFKTKGQFFKEVGVNLLLACAFVLLSTQKETLGALAFGLLVGCVYCGRLLFPSLFYILTGFLVGFVGKLHKNAHFAAFSPLS